MFEDVKPHLVELRKRIFISVLALVVGFIISFIFYKPILDWVTTPLDKALIQAKISVTKKEGEWKVKGSDENKTEVKKLSIVDSAIESANNIIENNDSSKAEVAIAKSLKNLAIYTKNLAKELNSTKNANAVSWGTVTTRQIGGVFMVALKVSLYASIFLALPIILWQGWLFVAPGLYDNEKKLALPFLIGTTVMFALGVLFAYYVVAPFGFAFLITFGAFLYTPLINIEDYIGFFAKILFGFGIAFELPMIVYFLALIGLVTDKTLKEFFRYAIVLIFIVAAILTPPDVITQLLMATPLILLYGVSIIIAKIINPYKEEDDEDEEDENKERKLLEDARD
jgi:sec-independent protein translocase protein TatC